MKGVSAVIAVVLILMITVALAAMAYVWFTGVFTTISEGAGASATKAGQDIATSFSIGAASMDYVPTGTPVITNNLTVYLTNTGTVKINKANVNVFVDNKLAINTTTPSGDLAPGLTATYRLWNRTGMGDIENKMKCGSAVKVAYGSLEQSTTIAC